MNGNHTDTMTGGKITVLGIETSCDETAVAVVSGCPGESPADILTNKVFSQIEDHRPYGGVVPEIAARAHIEVLDTMIKEAMEASKLDFRDLDGIAATAGPGLIGGVIVGLMTAKGIAQVHNLPFVGVNHLAGHALSARLTEKISFPYLLLLISGGHCQLLSVESPSDYRLFGTTLDDAVGEAFDKSAKLLGLSYPGGPSIEESALHGNPDRYNLPRPLLGRPGGDFSFSGLKTAVLHAAKSIGAFPLPEEAVADLAASFQAAIVDALLDRSKNAMEWFKERFPLHDNPAFVVAGGVAANGAIRSALTGACIDGGFQFVAPPPGLCTDNGAMIAWAGIEELSLGNTSPLDLAPRARWPLDADAAAPGAKA